MREVTGVLVAEPVRTLYVHEVTSKSDRLNLRIEPTLRELLEEGAKLMNMTLSSFIIGATRIRAEQLLADRVHFSASPEQWKAFMAALDRPPRKIERLQRLMNEPTALDSEAAKAPTRRSK